MRWTTKAHATYGVLLVQLTVMPSQIPVNFAMKDLETKLWNLIA